MAIDVPAAWRLARAGDLRGQAWRGSGEGEAQGAPPQRLGPEGATGSQNVGTLTLEVAPGALLRWQEGEVQARTVETRGCIQPRAPPPSGGGSEDQGTAFAVVGSQFSWEGASGKCCDILERVFPKSLGWQGLPVQPASQPARGRPAAGVGPKDKDLPH